MKMQTALLAAALLMGATVSRAQDAGTQPQRNYFSSYQRYAAIDVNKLERNYLDCLGSENDGVTESGLAHVVRMKLALPGGSFPRIQEAIKKLSYEGRTPAIRYKAYLASVVFDDVKMEGLAGCEQCGSPEALFAEVAARVQQTALSYNK